MTKNFTWFFHTSLFLAGLQGFRWKNSKWSWQSLLCWSLGCLTTVPVLKPPPLSQQHWWGSESPCKAWLRPQKGGHAQQTSQDRTVDTITRNQISKRGCEDFAKVTGISFRAVKSRPRFFRQVSAQIFGNSWVWFYFGTNFGPGFVYFLSSLRGQTAKTLICTKSGVSAIRERAPKSAQKCTFRHFLALFLELAETPPFVQINVFAVWPLKLDRKYTSLVSWATQATGEGRNPSVLVRPWGAQSTGNRQDLQALKPLGQTLLACLLRLHWDSDWPKGGGFTKCRTYFASQAAWYRMESGPKSKNGQKLAKQSENGPRPETGKRWPKNGKK